MGRIIGFVFAGFAVLALITVLLGTWYTVDEGERAVILYNGAFSTTADPGLHFKKPILEDVVKFSVRDNVKEFENLQAYTRDQQVATVTKISINYRINPSDVKEIYIQYGSIDRMLDQLLSRRASEALERTFGQYNAETAVRDRTKLGVDYSALIKSVKGPLEILSVQIENFSFPDEYEANINMRMAAEVEALKAQQTALKTVTEAKAAAEAQVAKATAQATSTRLAGEAEAAAIRAKGEALRDSPSLIELTKAERWNGILPTTMVPSGTVPFLDVNPAKQ